jgi:hypothetical protein
MNSFLWQVGIGYRHTCPVSGNRQCADAATDNIGRYMDLYAN